MKKCPRCGGEARRSHKHGFIQKRILHPFGIRPFRCRDCGNLFYRFAHAGKSAPTQQQTSGSSVFDRVKDRNGHFKELIAQMQAKEAELGLGKQDNGMADQLLQLQERARQEGLVAVASPVQQPSPGPRNGDSKPREKVKAASYAKQQGRQPADPEVPGLREIRPAELFPESKTPRP